MSRVADRFGRAAGTYDAATPIQRHAAQALADMVLGSGLKPGARAAEFGCGTGHLPRAFWPRLRPALWVATDIAPAMARAAQRSLPPEAVAAVMDAARPALASGFDLVCSSLTLQWLADPAGTVARWRALARPGGRLAVATLAEGSFREWRAALAAAGVQDAGPPFPPLAEIRSWFAPGAQVQALGLSDPYPDPLAFARAARAAGIDGWTSRALGAGTMRRALAALGPGPCALSYEVVLAVETA